MRKMDAGHAHDYGMHGMLREDGQVFVFTKLFQLKTPCKETMQ